MSLLANSSNQIFYIQDGNFMDNLVLNKIDTVFTIPVEIPRFELGWLICNINILPNWIISPMYYYIIVYCI